MVKKIVALSIAFVIMLSSVLYGTIDFAELNSPLSFGAGDGENTVIENTAELEKLLKNIPSPTEYLSGTSILEGRPDFQTFTMVEEGGVKMTSSSKTYYEGDLAKLETVKEIEHVLEICFAKDSVYYHVEGTNTDTSTYRTESNGNFLDASRTVQTYDADIFYSKDLIMIRFNEFGTKNEEKTSENGSWKAVETEEGDGDFESILLTSFLGAIEDSKGKWMKLEMSDTDYDNMDMPENLTPEQQIDFTVRTMVDMYSTMQAESIITTNEANVKYLTKLAGFITGENVTACFDKVGGDYVLKSNNAVKAAYLSLMLETNITEDRVYDSTRASASFNVESDVVTVLQDAAYSVNGNSVDLYCETTFKNIGNTVVNVKNADISTAYDIIGAPIKKVFEDMMEAQNNG